MEARLFCSCMILPAFFNYCATLVTRTTGSIYNRTWKTGRCAAAPPPSTCGYTIYTTFTIRGGLNPWGLEGVGEYIRCIIVSVMMCMVVQSDRIIFSWKYWKFLHYALVCLKWTDSLFSASNICRKLCNRKLFRIKDCLK